MDSPGTTGHPEENGPYDVFVIGGGVNGCGIARDAAGRGLRVVLAEMNDLASATSSASTKLIHGGLRYLEYFDTRLVREALKERELLLAAMPHIAWPMRFVLPVSRDMRFDATTPASRLLSVFFPWLKGRRPAWMIRIGLFFYDHMGIRKLLPATTRLDLADCPEGAPLRDHFRFAYEYSDCWVQDARLVVLNARDAAGRGARIMTRSKVAQAERRDGCWNVTVQTADGRSEVIRARCLINATGPWAMHVLLDQIGGASDAQIRLVRGSHIVVRKLYSHNKSYFFQGTDGRIVFAIPFERDFTLIGTTEAVHDDPDMEPVCTQTEADYLRQFVSGYFKKPVLAEDIVWTYSGVRPLYDDGSSSATATTREYVLDLDQDGPPLLTVFGGKITTYRRLAEAALAKVGHHFAGAGKPWTAGAPLPGGDFPVDGSDDLRSALVERYPFLDDAWSERMVHTYGTEAFAVLGDARARGQLGNDFGATITERELDWVIRNEWVQCADDFLWRRSKLGLRVSKEQASKIDRYIADRVAASA